MGQFGAFLAKRKFDAALRKSRREESMTAFNLVHESDLVLRKLVGERLASLADATQKSALGKELAKKKLRILGEIKSDLNGFRNRLLAMCSSSDDTNLDGDKDISRVIECEIKLMLKTD